MSVFRALAYLALSLSPLLVSCGGMGSSPNFNTQPKNTLSVSPQPSTLAAGASLTFTATTDATGPITWGVVADYGVGSQPPPDVGTLTPQNGGASLIYTAPAKPPVYPSNSEPAGTITLRASAGNASLDTPFLITAPTSTVGFYPPPATVALGGTVAVWAYVTGPVNNAVTVQVNGITGGSTTVGTIALVPRGFYGEYSYVAPATMPMTGSTITLTAIAQADPSKTATVSFMLQ